MGDFNFAILWLNDQLFSYTLSEHIPRNKNKESKQRKHETLKFIFILYYGTDAVGNLNRQDRLYSSLLQ